MKSETGNAVRGPGVRGKAISAIVLLAGGVRRHPLATALGRPLVDLPLPKHATMLAAWSEQAGLLARAMGQDVTLRALVNKQLELPRAVPAVERVAVRAEYDVGEFRGTGGLLHDVAKDYGDDDVLLVGVANQVLVSPLPDLLEMMRSVEADVVLLAEPDGTASGLQLVRCKCLRDIRGNGYLDFKEQCLPKIAKDFRVKVVRSPKRAALAVRSLEQYIRTLRALHLGSEHEADVEDPYAEEWSPTFSMVDETASVGKGALVHDSVVMRNARIGAGAVLVRSLVCEGAAVDAGRVVFDSVVGRSSSSSQSDGGSR
jgi:hypothetical protein